MFMKIRILLVWLSFTTMQGTIFEDKFLKPEAFWISPWNVKKPGIKTFKGIHSIYILSYRPFHLKAFRTLVSTLFAHPDFLLLLQNSQISSKITRDCVEQDIEFWSKLINSIKKIFKRNFYRSLYFNIEVFIITKCFILFFDYWK